MHIIELTLIAAGLTFDTLAVSVSTGLTVSGLRFLQAIRIAFVFASFHAIMPWIGWLGGKEIEKVIQDLDHWIAFSLLSVIGLKMIFDALGPVEEKRVNPLRNGVLLGLALATSIDAFVVGISLAFVGVNILLAMMIFGLMTGIISMAGMRIGRQMSRSSGRKVEVAGGLILMLIGFKVLAEHLF
jgi:manganese efflux pump family protein